MSIASTQTEFRRVPLALIVPPSLPSRAAMDPEKLEELARDIRAVGVLQPLIVARVGDRYEVVAGHRRYVASSRAGLVDVPCIVFPSMTAALERAKFSENKHREDLNAADEAIWFSDVLDRDYGGDVDQLAGAFGVTRAYVDNRLALFRGDQVVFETLQRGAITIGVAQQLNRCTDEPHRRSLLHAAVHGGATVATVSGWIFDWKRIKDATPPQSGAASSEPAPAPIPTSDPFRCLICGKNNNPHCLKYLPVHDYCNLAILEPLLQTYHGGDALDGTGNDPRRG